MKTGTPHPFSFVDNLLNLLIVDNNPSDRDKLCDLLAPAACFNLYTAESNRMALQYLRSGKRFHACICELGMNDIERDEFYLIRQYAHHSSVIIVTGSTSPSKGAECVTLGARAIYEKGPAFDIMQFVDTLNRMVLINIVNHRFREWGCDTLNQATRILFSTNPASVTEWAENMRLTDRQLRNIWHTSSGFGAKHILFLYHCFRNAFMYYSDLISSGSYYDPDVTAVPIARFSSYFISHREILTFLLS